MAKVKTIDFNSINIPIYQLNDILNKDEALKIKLIINQMIITFHKRFVYSPRKLWIKFYGFIIHLNRFLISF